MYMKKSIMNKIENSEIYSFRFFIIKPSFLFIPSDFSFFFYKITNIHYFS